MANPPIQNIWHLRTVADTASKPCMICFKPSTAVLITPDQKDFFYICRGHLSDKGFASPLVDPAVAEKKRKAALQAETDRVVAEWREKKVTQENKEKEKKKEESKEKEKNKENDENKDKQKVKDAEKDSDAKTSPGGIHETGTEPSPDELARIYALHRNFYQMRLDRLQKAEIARRNRELLRNPNLFPTVPKDFP